jgi:hypothetical protein
MLQKQLFCHVEIKKQALRLGEKDETGERKAETGEGGGGKEET